MLVTGSVVVSFVLGVVGSFSPSSNPTAVPDIGSGLGTEERSQLLLKTQNLGLFGNQKC